MRFLVPKNKPIVPSATDSERFGRYSGSFFEGNYVWGGAMNLCWSELSQGLIQAPIELRTDDPEALQMLEKLNQPVCSTADLDEASYYVKAGFGPQTVAAINTECRAKFPEKSFEDLNADLRPEDLISYAYLFKKVAYEIPFTQQEMLFEGQWVAGFEAKKEQKRTVEVLHYQDDEQFIIKLRLQDAADELILAKGYDTQQPVDVLQALAAQEGQKVSRMDSNDFFCMPLLKVNFRRNYVQLMNKGFANPGFTEYYIGRMYENIAFELDEAGAKVENEGVIEAVRGGISMPVYHRHFYLNKPFWVIMKRASSANPYFLLGVNNINIMQSKTI